MSRDPKYYCHVILSIIRIGQYNYIDVVQLVSCQTPLHGQVVDKSGSGKSRAQHLDMSRCWVLPFCCPLVADLQRTSCRQAVDKL